jgi:hypothetical protein
MRSLFLFIMMCTALNASFAQQRPALLSFQPADSLYKGRVYSMVGIGTVAYGGSLLLLKKAWYDNYATSPFHTFDDRKEWLQMDKVGHVFGGYFESAWFSKAFQWAGVPRNKARWIGVGCGTIIQGTLEVFDGFSSKWGFSKGDIGANTLGCALFIGQEYAWKEQRFCMKVSNTPYPYSKTPILADNQTKPSSSLYERARDLYGKSYIETFLKDYNNQTLWFSVNPSSFVPNNNWPKWTKPINIAIGYGAQNLYKGDPEYFWEKDGARYNVDPLKYPRYRQYYLSFDIDLTRIKVKNPILKTLLSGFNIIKIPAPTLEYNSKGQFIFHPLMF